MREGKKCLVVRKEETKAKIEESKESRSGKSANVQIGYYSLAVGRPRQ
jgi:hypothetical protein